MSTAIPAITDEFHGIESIGWYGSAFFLTLSCFQSAWGKAYKYFPLKWTYFVSIIIFEVGSLICGTSDDFAVFLFDFRVPCQKPIMFSQIPNLCYHDNCMPLLIKSDSCRSEQHYFDCRPRCRWPGRWRNPFRLFHPRCLHCRTRKKGRIYWVCGCFIRCCECSGAFDRRVVHNACVVAMV